MLWGFGDLSGICWSECSLTLRRRPCSPILCDPDNLKVGAVNGCAKILNRAILAWVT